MTDSRDPGAGVESERALREAAASLETIGRLAGLGECMLEDSEVRAYAMSRAGVARAALAELDRLRASLPAAPSVAAEGAAGRPVAWMNGASLITFGLDRERYPLGGGGDMATARYMRSDHHDTPLYLASPQPSDAQKSVSGDNGHE